MRSSSSASAAIFFLPQSPSMKWVFTAAETIFHASTTISRIAAAVFALFALALAGEALWRLC